MAVCGTARYVIEKISMIRYVTHVVTDYIFGIGIAASKK